MVRSNHSILWSYFTIRDKLSKLAKCNYCDLVASYKTTSGNLKHHLKRMHPRVHDDLIARTEVNKQPSRQDPGTRRRRSRPEMWKYFIRMKGQDKIATCIVCKSNFSYRSTTGNLSAHLKKRHSLVYNKMVRLSEANAAKRSPDGSNTEDSNTDEESENAKEGDLWAYFEREGGEEERARCVVCDEQVEARAEQLHQHFQLAHPKLVEQLVSQEHKLDARSDAGSSAAGEENDAFTEVVYLDRESSPEPETKYQRKPQKPTPKRERPDLTYDETPKRTHYDREDDELTTFTTYIKCLLKKLPPQVFEKVQLDIVNVILNARDKYGQCPNSGNGCIVLDSKHLVPGVLNVNDVGASGSSAANYSITVASCTPRGEDSAKV